MAKACLSLALELGDLKRRIDVEVARTKIPLVGKARNNDCMRGSVQPDELGFKSSLIGTQKGFLVHKIGGMASVQG